MSTRNAKRGLRTRLVGTREQRRMIDEAVAGLTSDTRRFLLHLVASSLYLLRRGQGGGGPPAVPLDREFLRRHVRHAEWSFLHDDGTVSVTEHDREAGRCREFTLADDWLGAYLDAGPTPDDVRAGRLVDIAGERLSPRRQRHRLSGQRGPRPPSSRRRRPGRSPSRSST